MPQPLGDIAAELERSLKADWGQLLDVMRDPQKFIDWLASWGAERGLTDDEVSRALDLLE